MRYRLRLRKIDLEGLQTTTKSIFRFFCVLERCIRYLSWKKQINWKTQYWSIFESSNKGKLTIKSGKTRHSSWTVYHHYYIHLLLDHLMTLSFHLRHKGLYSNGKTEEIQIQCQSLKQKKKNVLNSKTTNLEGMGRGHFHTSFPKTCLKFFLAPKS